MALETKNILKDWGYPVITNPVTLLDNCHRITREMLKQYKGNSIQLVGIGGSGAMILGALSVLQIYKWAKWKFVYLGPKLSKYDFDDSPIIIVDDHVTSGLTLLKIAFILKQNDLLNNVEGVVMNEWKGAPGYFEKNKAELEKVFPTAKFWIH